MIIYLNQNHRSWQIDGGVDGGIRKHLDQNHQNHLLWFMNLQQFLLTQILLWHLIMIVGFH